MTKKSVRIQLDSEHQQTLSSIALEHGCVYNGKGNLSFLLEKVATGILEINSPALREEKKQRTSSEQLVGLELKILSDLNGVIALITEKIGKGYKGNIYDIKARNADPNMRITLHIPKEVDLNHLIADLRTITVRELLKFNQLEKKEKLLEAISPEHKRSYDLLKKKKESNNYQEFEQLINNFLEDFHEKSIIIELILIIGFRAEIKNIPGNLSILAKELAQKYISILEIDQKVAEDGQKNIADLFLGFNPLPQKKPINEIKNIKRFTEKLKKMECIEDISQLNIHYL
jgi:ACT domain-containing protein